MSDEVRKRASRLHEAIHELEVPQGRDGKRSKERLLEDTSFLREVLESALALCAKELAEPASIDVQPGAPSTRFGRFELLGVLGQGGMGTVHLAFDTLLQRRVALKQVRLDLVFSAEARQRFVREARIVSSLDHPNICRVFDTGEHDGVPFLVMQLVEGKTLAEHIAEAGKHRGAILEREGSADHDAVLAAFEELARALHYAHERGLLHRDVKPANIMIRKDGVAVLLDFGLAQDAKTADNLTLSHQVLGTRAYMSPEQVLGRTAALDARTDVYSLAVTLYEACTGSRPFEADSDLELSTKIVRGGARMARALNHSLPSDLDRVLALAMDPERERRYASCLALAEDLRRVRVREPILGKPPSFTIRALRWTQRNPLVTAFLVVTSTMLAVLGWLYWVASERLSDLDSVNCMVRFQELRVRSDELHPAWPENEAALSSLLADSETLLSEMALLRAKRSALESRSSIGASGDRRFARRRDAFVHRALTYAIDELLRFDTTDMEDLRHRHEMAVAFTAASHIPEDDAWATVRREIAQSPHYDHLDLSPQVGLVPLGRDPRSGLQEFADVQSGAPPHRDPITQQLQLDESSAVVFVLIPARTVLIGEQFEYPCVPHYLPLIKKNPHYSLQAVELEAFLIGKHEVTQAQWMRITHNPSNPSRYRPPPHSVPGWPTTSMHPVENITSLECEAAFRRMGWLLPTEAQWEYACRGGTSTTWWTGATVDSLSGAENLPDEAAAEATPWPGAITTISDGFVIHAPVDALLPNPFGLYGMHGNVMEWCRDFGAPDDWIGAEVIDLEGQKLVHTKEQRARRGGCYDSGHILFSRAAFRWPIDLKYSDADSGCRAMRRILKGS